MSFLGTGSGLAIAAMAILQVETLGLGGGKIPSGRIPKLLGANDRTALRNDRSGLLELEALQSQLDAKISQVLEALPNVKGFSGWKGRSLRLLSVAPQ